MRRAKTPPPSHNYVGDEGIVLIRQIKRRRSDVGSPHPGGEAAPKGWPVRPLKRYVSWVQTVRRRH